MKYIFENWEEVILKKIQASNKVKIICPFITKFFVNTVINKCSLDEISVITRFNLNDFLSKASDPIALKNLLVKGAKIRGIKKLHSKVYIFDDKEAIITSANLTEGGLKNNAECGILVDSQSGDFQKLLDYFDNLYKVGENDLELNELEDWISIVEVKRDELGNSDDKQNLGDFGKSVTGKRKVEQSKITKKLLSQKKLIAEIDTKIAEYINFKNKYKCRLSNYICQSVKRFNEFYDASLNVDFVTNMKNAVGSDNCLLPDPACTSIQHLIEEFPKVAEREFKNLFDETRDLRTRIEEFQSNVNEKIIELSEVKTKWINSQSVTIISIYLFLRFPDKYVICSKKMNEKRFYKIYSSELNSDVDKYLEFLEVIRHLKEENKVNLINLTKLSNFTFDMVTREGILMSDFICFWDNKMQYNYITKCIEIGNNTFTEDEFYSKLRILQKSRHIVLDSVVSKGESRKFTLSDFMIGSNIDVFPEGIKKTDIYFKDLKRYYCNIDVRVHNPQYVIPLSDYLSSL